MSSSSLYYESQYDLAVSDESVLRSLPLDPAVLLPVCDGLALMPASLQGGIVIRLSPEWFVGVPTRELALECVGRLKSRLRACWLDALLEENDEVGVERFGKKVNLPKREEWESEDLPKPSFRGAMEFFEKYDE